MKTFYQCEECGRKYGTPDGAAACEKKHADAEQARKKEREEKGKLEKDISSLVAEYYTKYGKLPTIQIGNDKYYYVKNISVFNPWF